MVWGSSGSAAGLTPTAALMCFNAADSGAANDITGQIGAVTFFFFFWKEGAVKLPSSQWQADRSHSGIQVPLRVLIRRLGALSTLTYRGFISWPVGFLSESGSGMICILTSQSFSDGEVVFFLYDQINLTRAKRGERKKNGIWNSPLRCLVEPSCNAFCFPSAWCSCKAGNYKSRGGPKRDRND